MTQGNKHQVYLGDGAYAHYDGYHVVLTTGHHLISEADNVIALDPDVMENVAAYIFKIQNLRDVSKEEQ